MRAAVGGGKLPLLKVSRGLRIYKLAIDNTSLGGKPSSRSWHTDSVLWSAILRKLGGLNRNPGKVVLARKVKKNNKSTIGIFFKV